MANLSSMRVGQTAKINMLRGGSRFIGRATAMGFTPATQITMLQNIGNGPILVFLRDTQVALGRGEAQKIDVSMEANDS